MGVKTNTGYNLGGTFASAALTLLSVPLFLSLIGEERYGLLAIIWLLIGYFGFFDFGLGQAAAYKIALLDGKKNDHGARVLWTALALNMVFGFLGGVLIYLLAPLLFQYVFNTSDRFLNEIAPTYFWIALAIPIATLEGVFAGTLMGRGRFLALNIRIVVGAALVQFFPLISMALLGANLSIAVISTVIARALSLGILATLAFRAVRASAFPRWGDTNLLKELLGYGGWITLGKSVLQLVGNLDRFVIASVLTPVAVTLYSVPFQLIARGGQIPRALATAMFPDFATRNEQEARPLALNAIRANLAIMTIICFVLIASFRPFLRLWISEEFADQAGLAASIIALSLWVNAIAIIAIMLLEAQRRPKTTFLVSCIQAPPYALLVFIGAIFGGITGVALARNVRSVIDAGLLCGFAGLLRSVVYLLPAPASLLIGSVWWNANVQGSTLWLGNFALLICSIFLASRIFPQAANVVFEALRRAKSRPKEEKRL